MRRFSAILRTFFGVLFVALGTLAGLAGGIWVLVFSWLWFKGDHLSQGDHTGWLNCAALGIVGGLILWAGALLLRGRTLPSAPAGPVGLVLTGPQRRRSIHAARVGTFMWLGVGAEILWFHLPGTAAEKIVPILQGLAVLYLGVQAVVLCHELGHFCLAALFRMDLQKLQVGTGPALINFRLGGTRVEWRLWLGGGMVWSADDREQGWRWRHWVYVAGGPAASAAVCLALAWWIRRHNHGAWTSSDPGDAASILALYLLGQSVLLLVQALIPMATRIGTTDAKSDGHQLLRTPRFSPETVRMVIILTTMRRVQMLWEDGRREAAWTRLREILAHYPTEPALSPAEGHYLAESGEYHAAVESLERWLQADSLPEAVRRQLAVERFAALAQAGEISAARECSAGALREVASSQRPGLLDNLATTVLSKGLRDFLPDAYIWSQEALTQSPNLPTLKGTLGSLLVELGRLDEGEALLREVWATSASEVDAAICAFYLGLVAKQRGNRDQFRRWCRRSRSFAPFVGEWLTQRLDRERATAFAVPPDGPPAPVFALPPPLPHLLPRMSPVPATPPRRWSHTLAGCALALVAFIVLGSIAYVGSRHGVAWQRMLFTRLHGFRPGHQARMQAETSEPIPRDPQATTAEADRRLKLTWARRTMLAGYDHAGRRNARWNTAARAFIDRALPWWAGLHDCTVTEAELLPQSRNVLRTGCDDPLVLYLAGLVEARGTPQAPAAASLFTRAVAGFEKTPYTRGVAMLAAAELVADCDRRRDGTGESKPVKQWWLLWFEQALSDGSFAPVEQVALASLLAQGKEYDLFNEQREVCCRAVDEAGPAAVAPWLRLWLSGRRHLEAAWDARGDDYASKVTTEQWRSFEAGLALARRDLVASWQLNPRRPEAAALMISVALGQNQRGSDGPRAWFDRAARAQVDYPAAYSRMYNVLLPQWHGSYEDVLAFGLTCAATADYDTGVPMQLNEAANRMEPGEGYGDPRVYEALERMYAGYEAAPSQAGRRVYYHHWHARAAELTGRYPEAYRLLKEVDFALSPEVAAEQLTDDPHPGGYVERIAAYGGPGGSDARAGDDLIRRGRKTEALERFRAALAAGGSEPRAAAYLQGRIGALDTEQQLAAGSWISFQPAAGTGGVPVGWTSKLGTWRVAADGALVGQAGASGLMLVNDTKVGADFEVRGEMDFLPGALSESQSGVVFGHPDMDRDDWQSFRLKRNGPDGAVATVSCHWHDGPRQPIAVPEHNAFALQSWHGQLTLTVNGRVVFREERLAEGRVNDGSVLVGLGGYAHHGNTFGVAYRKLQIRRLDVAPVAANAGSPPRDGTVAQR